MTRTALAEQLAADAQELGTDTATLNAAAWQAGVDASATDGLVGAAVALGAPPAALVRSLRALPTDTEMLSRSSDLETSAADLLKCARDLHDQAEADLEAASAAAAAAADACTHAGTEREAEAAEAALAAAQAEIADCECAQEIAGDLAKRLDYALTCLGRVPDDLLTTYEIPYDHIHRGGALPYSGEFITGVSVGPAQEGAA